MPACYFKVKFLISNQFLTMGSNLTSEFGLTLVMMKRIKKMLSALIFLACVYTYKLDFLIFSEYITQYERVHLNSN